jgi:acetylornithine deacetylase/succinyl-diaminopimelate desuccinylase-like protein
MSTASIDARLDWRAVSPSPEALVVELAELIAIPSISADDGHRADVYRAADWVCDRIRRAGGEAEVVDLGAMPLAIGEVPASTEPESAPTVLCYAHFDVQPPDPVELWETPPFELTQRDGWLYARGVADDKAHLFVLLKAVELLRAEDALPVNVRFACDGEEEVGGHSIVDWLEQDSRGADAAIVLDGGMVARDLPGFTIGLRGICYFHVTVRTGDRDLHSGMFGGVALNAIHALMRALSAVVAGPDGLLPEPLRAGIIAPTEAELESWRSLPSGEDELRGQGATRLHPRAAEDFYVRTTAEPSVDVNGIESGSPRLQMTVLPVEAHANVSMRLAPGQDPNELAKVFERLVREAAPDGASVEVDLWTSSKPALVAPDSRAITLAQDAFEATTGVRPLLVRTGGSIPIVATLVARGIPAVVTGFALSESNVHSPNERLVADYLPLGVRTAQELFRRFAGL